jgi:MYXO-CTERM domain-containing protein
MTADPRLAACLLLAAAVARADGAFPNTESLFLPVDQPNRIVLTTNFGLIQSLDDGRTWDIRCEISMLAPNASLYTMGPAPDHRLIAYSLNGLSYSDDDGCSWALTDGGIPENAFKDMFIDPSNGDHVVSVGQISLDGGSTQYGIYESLDGAAFFNPTPLFSRPAPPTFITGVEIAKAVPSRWYATMFVATPGDSGFTYTPYVLRTDNDGGTWIVNDLTSSIGSNEPRLIAVDPVDPNVVYLRLINPSGVESLGIATDGGGVATSPLTLPPGQQMMGFLRREDGTLIVTQYQGPGSFISVDHGATWQPYLQGYHLTAVAERDGGLYVANDNNYNDGFAVGQVQDDGGITPLLLYPELSGLAQCGDIPTACALWWAGAGLTCERRLLGVPPGTCGDAPDAGPDSGAADAGTTANHNGCGCAAGFAPALLVAGALAALAAIARRRRT